MRLIPHPDTPSDAVTSLEATAARSADGLLTLSYVLTGAIADLALPPAARPLRADELWRHTCFEAFVRPASGDGYLEINAAPSGAWTAYAFDGYREGMREAEVSPPGIGVRPASDRFELTAVIDLAALPAPWRLGLSAVIEETSGRKSYWALAHALGKPDFHHPAAFVLALPEPA